MAERVNRVEGEFILREIQERNIPLQLHGAGKAARACLKEVRKDSLRLDLQGSGSLGFCVFEPLSVYFEFRGKDMTFATRVLGVDANRLSLAYPEHLLRSPSRKYPRVPCPKGCSLEIMLENEKVRLDYPRCEEYSDVSLPDLHEGFDVRTLNTLIESFKQKSEHMASESRVVLFKERPPTGIEERLIARYGKTLFIPSTRSPLPLSDPYPEARIITGRMLSDFEGLDAILEGSHFERSQAVKIGRAINAEIWCPIQYYQYVVGYVYLANRADRPMSMDFSVVDCAWEFSRILAYYLKTNGYFQSSPKDDAVTHAAGIVDLSASGCLLSIPKSTLAMRIKTGALLDLRLKLPEGGFAARGKVVRRYDDKEGAYYGVAFLGITSKELRVLYPKIYEIPYKDGDDPGGEARMKIETPI